MKDQPLTGKDALVWAIDMAANHVDEYRSRDKVSIANLEAAAIQVERAEQLEAFILWMFANGVFGWRNTTLPIIEFGEFAEEDVPENLREIAVELRKKCP